LLDEPAFLEARVDTTFLDRALATRNGTPFAAATAESEDVAAIAAALHTLGSGRAAHPLTQASTSAWTRSARLGALR
jgi:hypothetical protein